MADEDHHDRRGGWILGGDVKWSRPWKTSGVGDVVSNNLNIDSQRSMCILTRSTRPALERYEVILLWYLQFPSPPVLGVVFYYHSLVASSICCRHRF